MEKDANGSRRDEQRARKAEKKTYTSPRLTKHGSVKKLTRLVGGEQPDGYSGDPS